MIVFALLSDRFLTPGNISLILQQVAVVGTLAVGQTIVILTAGIDLSCGAIMVLTSIVMAKVASETGLPGLPALLLGLFIASPLPAQFVAMSWFLAPAAALVAAALMRFVRHRR